MELFQQRLNPRVVHLSFEHYFLTHIVSTLVEFHFVLHSSRKQLLTSSQLRLRVLKSALQFSSLHNLIIIHEQRACLPHSVFFTSTCHWLNALQLAFQTTHLYPVLVADPCNLSQVCVF